MMNDLKVIEQATKAFTNSNDSFELCRHLVHSNFAESNPTGALLLAVDQKGQLRSIASYGDVANMPRELSLWDANPLSEAIQTKTFARVELEGTAVAVVPFIKHSAPVGALVLSVSTEVDFTDLKEAASRVLAQLGAFYLEINGLNVRQPGTDIEVSNELTERQLTVLSMMALGQTNAEISRAMLLSESTIRQETVRIYRSLGVSSRSEASKKGKALGLISRAGGGELTLPSEFTQRPRNLLPPI
jgi:DNA-binding CsgD family transcriptional regulator